MGEVDVFSINGHYFHPGSTGYALASELARLQADRDELAAAVDRVRKRHPRGDEEPGPLAPGLWCPTCGRERADNGYGACPDRAALVPPRHPETSAVSDRDAGREESTE